MSIENCLKSVLKRIASLEQEPAGLLERIRTEIGFARAFSALFPNRQAAWESLSLQAAEAVEKRLASEGFVGLAQAVSEAEDLMAPIGQAAKEHVIHCCGHAHIDMNWAWPWLETIAMSHDTFLTVDRLMDAFPGFKFAQNQITVYEAMERYCPEIFETIRRRIEEGRWDCTASMWTEGDKNMASGESLCRHILYSKRYLKERLGLPYDAVNLDWAGDTFGHAWTLPAILSRGGVTRYYHMRPGRGPWLTRWQAPDGSEVLEFNDKGGYGGAVTPQMAHLMLDYAKETGLKDFLFIYGVVDHGGGPTRQHLLSAEKLSGWPIFPTVRLSTTGDYFTAVEKCRDRIPIHRGEINFIFEGCYTSQSKVKRVNRAAETLLPESEAVCLIAGVAAGFPYPAEAFRRAWKLALFNQFHDILAGSSGHEAMEQAEARFQEAEALAGSARMRALRGMASRIDTAAATGLEPPAGKDRNAFSDSIGFGAGDIRIPGRMPTVSMGAVECEPVVVFNALPFPRSETVTVKLWNRMMDPGLIVVRDHTGKEVAAQVAGSSAYSEHRSVNILFPAREIPAMGYRTYSISEGSPPSPEQSAALAAPGVLENDFLRVEVDIPSGAIRHLIDKATGYDYAPEGRLMAFLEMCREVPHAMTSWDIGAFDEAIPLLSGWQMVDEASAQDNLDGDSLGMVVSRRVSATGPHRAAIRVLRRRGDSRISIETALSAGSPTVEITLHIRWREIGTPETGVPNLRMALPVNIQNARAAYEIPFGHITRDLPGQEVPALRWADLTGSRTGGQEECGLTLLNDGKHGHSASGDTLRLTLLRSSYDPDPLPEIGSHTIRLKLCPHAGPLKVWEADRAASAFNQPPAVVTTDIHAGPLPPLKSFAETLTPNIVLAAIKRAEDTGQVLLRLYETEGADTEARIRLTGLARPGAAAVECDLLERPLSRSAARMEGDILYVPVSAFGLASVLIGEAR